MDGSERAQAILSEPRSEEMPVQSKSNCDQFHQFERLSVHQVILLVEEVLNPLVFGVGREGSVLV